MARKGRNRQIAECYAKIAHEVDEDTRSRKMTTECNMEAGKRPAEILLYSRQTGKGCQNILRRKHHQTRKTKAMQQQLANGLCENITLKMVLNSHCKVQHLAVLSK